MSELSDNAKRLAETLCGADYEMADGGIRGGLDHAADGHHFLHKYDTASLLEIASAALELAGVEVEFKDEKLDEGRYRGYQLVRLFETQIDGIWINLRTQTMHPESAVEIACELLDAARTAREWASEGGK